ncbi:MAG: hypothetical protein HY820_32230 [Acidobacteria bacterium]|nr:hypothetical protein [Acidobacteriota bacterium]
MSVARLVFGKRLELKVRRDAPLGEGAVLSGVASVEMEREREREARRYLTDGGERYRNVGEYDAVLRGHCRLDGEG